MFVGRTKQGRGQARHPLRAAFGAALLLGCAGRGNGQAMPTASRIGDLQIGGGLALGRSNYNFNTASLLGETAYAAFDIRKHWGAEVDFHNVKDSGDTTVYERTFEFGARYQITRGPFVPYAKLMYGRGIYNFPNGVAN